MSVRKSTNPVVSASAGAVAGGIEACIIWPSEYTKTHLQLGRNEYNGMLDCARQKIRANGPLALYRGLPAALMFAIPKAGIRFGVFNTLKTRMADVSGHTSTASTFVAGLGAGVAEATLVVTPQETIKTKLIETNANLGACGGTVLCGGGGGVVGLGSWGWVCGVGVRVGVLENSTPYSPSHL